MGFIGRAVSPIPITASDVPDLPASKITSGTLADARVSSSSVTQHSAPTDLQPIKSDISALALREATNESSASFNLPNQFIDTFATDTLGTKTTVAVSDGYVASIYYGTPSLIDYDDIDGAGEDVEYKTSGNISTHSSQNITSFADIGSEHQNIDAKYWLDNFASINRGGHFGTLNAVPQDSTDRTTHYMILDLKATYQLGGTWYFGKQNGYGDLRKVQLQTSLDDTTYTNVDLSGSNYSAIGISGSSSDGRSVSGTEGKYVSNASDGTFILNQHAGQYWATVNTISNFPTTNARYIKLIFMNQYTGTANGNAGFSFNVNKAALTTSATGTAIQNTNTVGSAKTKVGGTILYKDNSGTATLGTDLKIYFTCNGGSNWTEASSYSAITPVYSTGIKQVRLGETTCTSGTDIRYKAVWANQASGSKETQLHGIGINY